MFCDESMNYELDFIERLLFEPTSVDNNKSERDLNQAMRKNQRERMRVSRLNQEFDTLAFLVEKSSWYQTQFNVAQFDNSSDKENWCRRNKTMTKLDILRHTMRYISHLTSCLSRIDYQQSATLRSDNWIIKS